MRIKTDIWAKSEELKGNIEWIIIYNLLGILSNIISNHWISITFGVSVILLDLALIKSKRKEEKEKAMKREQEEKEKEGKRNDEETK